MRLIKKDNQIIKICFVFHKSTNIDFFKQIFRWINDYLNISVSYFNELNPEENDVLEQKTFDFIFVDYIDKYKDVFAWDFYSKIHEINKKFKLIFLLNNYSKDDYVFYKNGVDDLIYNNNNYVDMKWKFMSLLRRFWDFSWKETTLIHNGVIIDLIKRVVILNNKEINITKKEFALLEILVNEFQKQNGFVSKSKIFKTIYKTNIIDNTRVVDQLIFRLKSKFKPDFFLIEPKKGIKIK